MNCSTFNLKKIVANLILVQFIVCPFSSHSGYPHSKTYGRLDNIFFLYNLVFRIMKISLKNPPKFILALYNYESTFYFILTKLVDFSVERFLLWVIPEVWRIICIFSLILLKFLLIKNPRKYVCIWHKGMKISFVYYILVLKNQLKLPFRGLSL